LVESPVGTVVDTGPNGYATLALLAEPRSLGEVLDRLEAAHAGTTELAPTVNLLNQLIEEGILVEPASPRGPTSGWADPVEHGRMLHDERRTGDYLAAIGLAVRPGDVVVDLGTGSGVLAVAAARAGARKVYAIEASDIADVARAVFERNGVDDVVTLVPGWSRHVELPELADVLVAEIIGNEPFEEDILESTIDARRRLVKPGAILVPHGLTLCARPLLIPEEEARGRSIGERAVRRWRELYGMDFEPLRASAVPGPVQAIVEAEVVASWSAVGEPVELAHLDLVTVDDVGVHATAELSVADHGCVNAVAITFCAHLHGGVDHVFDPWRWPWSSWATSVWVLPEPLEVGTAQVVGVEYVRRARGRVDGVFCDVVDRDTVWEGHEREPGFVRSG
jgi:protein arginine N-methyltransferase 1